MTVIVAIKATNGVVLAADGAATFGSPDLGFTIKQPVVKIQDLGKGVLYASAGAVGLSQELEDKFQDLSGLKGNNKPMFKDRDQFREFVNKQLFPCFKQKADIVREMPGDRLAQMEASHSSLWAFPSDSGVELCQLSKAGAVEFATQDLPFVSAGSGQPAADPFLAFLRKTIWSEKVPTLKHAVLYAIWAVRHTIDVQPGMVSDPIAVATLVQTNNKQPYAVETKMLEGEEIEQHFEMIDEILNKVKTHCANLFTSQTSIAIPDN